MLPPNAKPGAGDAGPRERCIVEHDYSAPNTQTPRREQGTGRSSAGVIIAELSGTDSCTTLGIVAQSTTPILQLCRMLLERGRDPALALDAFRGGVLALRVRSIGEGATLEINGKGCGFKHRAAVGIGPSVRNSVPAATRHRPGGAP
jgi:hypothetical protein